MGYENFATPSIFNHLSSDDLDRAFRSRNGHGDFEMKKMNLTEPNNPIEVAVDALTRQFIVGAKTAHQYAATIKALKQ